VTSILRNAADALDHLLLGAADLDAAIAWFEARTGVRAAIGGSHPGMGTRNALVSLGAPHYLEIIAADPAQSAYGFHLDVRTLSEPRLVTWAASTSDIDGVAQSARRSGLEAVGPRDGSRARPDGTRLHWRTLGVTTTFGAAAVDPVPFFIQWAAGTRHPSEDAPGGCRLLSLECAHPDPDALRQTLASLSLDIHVQRARTPAIRATIDTPRGRLKL
jgi:hypothetical protein